MIVVPNWQLCPTIRVLFSGEADWLFCQDFVGVLKTHLPSSSIFSIPGRKDCKFRAIG